MTIDLTGLHPIPMRKSRKTDTWRGCYYVLPEDHSVCVAKTCGTCHAVVPVAGFGRVPGNRFEVHSRCLMCRRIESFKRDSAIDEHTGATHAALRTRASRTSNCARTPEEIAEAQAKLHPEGTATCKTCRLSRDLRYFHADSSRGDGLEPSCKTCRSIKRADVHTKAFIAYWEANGIPLRCYLCDGPYEEIEHLIPTSLPHGDPGPTNTRPACITCNRGQRTGKHATPLEEYIFSVNHPTKSRGEILHEIIMSGTWPFSLTSPKEFIELSLNYEE